MKNRFVISIGSNSADSAVRVGRAIEHLESVLSEMRSSSVYRTPSVCGDGTIYTNAVVSGLSSLDAEEMDRVCKAYERECGRKKGKGEPVVIDLDVVIINSEVLRPKDAARSYFTIGLSEIG